MSWKNGRVRRSKSSSRRFHRACELLEDRCLLAAPVIRLVNVPTGPVAPETDGRPPDLTIRLSGSNFLPAQFSSSPNRVLGYSDVVVNGVRWRVLGDVSDSSYIQATPYALDINHGNLQSNGLVYGVNDVQVVNRLAVGTVETSDEAPFEIKAPRPQLDSVTFNRPPKFDETFIATFRSEGGTFTKNTKGATDNPGTLATGNRLLDNKTLEATIFIDRDRSNGQAVKFFVGIDRDGLLENVSSEIEKNLLERTPVLFPLLGPYDEIDVSEGPARVVITGAHLNTTKANLTVFLNSRSIQFEIGSGPGFEGPTLDLQLSAADVAGLGSSVAITVRNAKADGNGTSNSIVLKVKRPAVPTVTSITPSDVQVGTTTSPLISLFGDFATGLVDKLKVIVNGIEIVPESVTSGEVRFRPPASILASEGFESVAVRQAAPNDVLTSNAINLRVGPKPTLVTPPEGPPGPGGTGFLFLSDDNLANDSFADAVSSVVLWDGQATPAAFYNGGGTFAFTPPVGGMTAGTHTVQGRVTKQNGAVLSTGVGVFVTRNPAITEARVDFALVTHGSLPEFRIVTFESVRSFVPGVKFVFGGVEVPTTYVNANEIRVSIPANLIPARISGPNDRMEVPCSLANPEPNFGIQTFTIPIFNAPSNPTSISPSSAPFNAGDLTVTLRAPLDEGFSPGVSQARLVLGTGADLPLETVATSTALTAVIPGSFLAAHPSPDAYTIVINTGGSVQFQVTDAKPTNIRLSQYSLGRLNSPNISILGSGFSEASIVIVDGVPLSPTQYEFVSQTELRFGPSSFVLVPHSATVKVRNPGLGGGESNTVTLAVMDFAPVILSASVGDLSHAPGGTIFVRGSFKPGATFLVNGANAEVVSSNSTQVEVRVPQSVFDTFSMTEITATNPDGQSTTFAPTTRLGVRGSSIPISDQRDDATVLVTRTGDTSRAVSVNYMTIAGAGATANVDFTPTAGTLMFAVGETTQVVTVPVFDDGAPRGRRTVSLALSAPTNGATITGSGIASFDLLDDSGLPMSSVNALPAQSSTRFSVSWAGTDDIGGAGIDYFDVYVSDNNGEYTPWLIHTTSTSAMFEGLIGHTYRFYTVATDKVGNEEAAPLSADATTLVNNNVPTIANPLADQSAAITTAFAFTVPMDAFNDVEDGTKLTYTASKSGGSALPAWLSFNATSRTFSGTPASSDFKTILPIAVTAKDSRNATVTSTFTLTVVADIAYVAGGSEVLTASIVSSRLAVRINNVANTQFDNLDPAFIRKITITGASGADSINLTGLTSTLYTRLSSISLNGGAGNDTIDGSGFNEMISGGSGNDSLAGGGGFDRLVEQVAPITSTTAVTVTLSPTAIPDTFTLSGFGTDSAYGFLEVSLGGGAGNDELDTHLFSGRVTLNGNAGNDTLLSGVGFDSLEGSTGTDLVSASGATSFVLSPGVLDGLGIDELNSIEQVNLATANIASNINAVAFTGKTTLTGGNGNDTIQGGSGDDSIMGGLGNDSISGGAGVDLLSGGEGAADVLSESTATNMILTSTQLSIGVSGAAVVDSVSGFEKALLFGGGGANVLDASGAGLPVTLFGGGGNDVLIGGSQADNIDGQGGNDTVTGGAGNDTLNGSAGMDGFRDVAYADSVMGQVRSITLTNTAFLVKVGAGTLSVDSLLGFELADITGGAMRDIIDASSFTNAIATTINGGGGNDVITGTPGADMIFTATGADSISGLGGADMISSGSGNDTLNGGDGIDNLNGQNGNDLIFGDAGNDVLVGGAGVDTLNGGADNDFLSGQTEQGLLNGGDGNDVLQGNLLNDTLNGDAGDDRLLGLQGDDLLSGGDGADTFFGSTGNDTLMGGAGADDLRGEVGSDSIDGGAGTDRINEVIDTNVTIATTLLATSMAMVSLGTDSITNVERINLSGGPSANFFDARNAEISVLLSGEAGNDTLIGGSKSDIISGGEGNDVLSGGGSNDVIDGGNGTDYVFEKADTNFMVNGITITSSITGIDTPTTIERIALIGGIGANKLDASLATVSVILIGGRGNDTLLGGNAADTLTGGNRNDATVIGGDGTDSLDGGAGADTLETDPADTLTPGDTILADVFASLPSWIDVL